MNLTKQKREEALKRRKKKRNIAIGVGVLATALLIGLFVMDAYNNRNNRVFSDGNSRVTLQENGNFRAQLPHGVIINGTYVEEATGTETTITFVHGGHSFAGSIVENVLILPDEWDDGCNHNNRLPLAR